MVVIIGTPQQGGFVLMNVFDWVTLSSILINLKCLHIVQHSANKSFGENGCDALSRRRGIALPFCSFIIWATSSWTSSLVIMSQG